MIYHYTLRTIADEILKDRRIRCRPDIGYPSLSTLGKGKPLGAIIWLTDNRLLEGTVGLKVQMLGLPLVGNVVRFGVADDCGLTLREWCRVARIHPKWLTGKLLTAVPGSEDAWRVATADIPAERWQAIEILEMLPNVESVRSEEEFLATIKGAWQPYRPAS